MKFAFVVQGEHEEADHLDSATEQYLASVVKVLAGRGYVGTLGCDFGRATPEVEFPAAETVTGADVGGRLLLEGSDGELVLRGEDLAVLDPGGFTVPALQKRLKWLSGRGLTKMDCDVILLDELAGKNRDTAVRALKQARDALGP